MSDWTLGQTSSKYETGGRGPGTVSTGKGDHGGVSYGSYQLSTAEGTVQEFLRDQPRMGAAFKNLTPGTEAFSNQWKAQAAADPQGFHAAQHDFIQHRFYDVQLGRLQNAGVDLGQRGAAVQDMLWSTSVQYRGLTKGIVSGALEGKNLNQLSDADIVSAVQDYKRDHNSTLFASSKALWPGLLRRAADEKQDLLELARSYGGDKVANELSAPSTVPTSEGTSTAEKHALSPGSLRLLQDSESHVRALSERHRLPWDQGMTNTVHALALHAREHGMTEITHMKVTEGGIRFGQFDGATFREGSLDAKEAANTSTVDATTRLASLDRQAATDTGLACAPNMESPALSR